MLSAIVDLQVTKIDVEAALTLSSFRERYIFVVRHILAKDFLLLFTKTPVIEYKVNFKRCKIPSNTKQTKEIE